MATKFDIREDDRWYRGADYAIKFKVWEKDGKTPRNAAGYNLSWMLKRRASDLDSAAILTKAIGSGIAVTGTFNLDPALNTQLVEVSIADTDTDPIKSGVYVHELKRTDTGLETVLCSGAAILRGALHQS